MIMNDAHMNDHEPYIHERSQSLFRKTHEMNYTLREIKKEIRSQMDMALVPVEKCVIFDKIKDNLFLGDIEAAKAFQVIKNIDVVINVSNTEYNEYPNTSYFNYPIDDHRSFQISKYFNEINDVIQSHITDGKKVLIHCYNAVSRSVTILIAYLMSTGLTLKESLTYVKSKRLSGYTRPNIGFFKQLIEYEKSLFGTNSMKVSDFTQI